MPEEELPEDFSRPIGSPSISSLSSTSSDVILINAHYINNGRGSSIRSGSATSEESLRISRITNVPPQRSTNRERDGDEDVMTYQPIKIPKEPTLEELLRQVLGNSIDFHEVNQVKLRIISSSLSLHRLPYFLPKLKILSLEGSILFSLRDLGSDLNSLTYLNVSRCGLKSLDGTNGLINLIELVADSNNIDDAGPCMNLPKIRKISLANNRIEDFQSIMFLGLCSDLKCLNLSGNLISRSENYRETVKGNLLNLEMLDRIPFDINMSDEDKTDLLRSEYQTGEVQVRRSFDEMVNTMTVNARNRTFRPISAEQMTAQATESGTNPLNNRPSTARDTRPKYNISIGEPVCGSVITRARKPKSLRTAWGDSCSSSSFSSDSSTHATQIEKSEEHNLATYDELLDTARIWREKSRASRDKFNND